MSLRNASVVVVGLCLGTVACYDRPSYVPPTQMPSEYQRGSGGSRAPGTSAIEETGLGAGALSARVDEFVHSIGQGGWGSIGCFPLVSYDLVHDGPWVSALGEAVAERVTDLLLAKSTNAFVLGPRELEIRASDTNVPREALSTLVAVKDHGPRLGVDAFVFGTIHRRDHVQARNRHELTLELNAYDIQAGRLLAKDSFRLPSDVADNVEPWRMATQEGTWLPLRDWPVPEPAFSLERELATLSGMLARRIGQHISGDGMRGKVYVAPADTSRFVGAVSRLRGAQAAYAMELARREAEAAATGNALDRDYPLVLNGVEFGSLQVAEAYMTELREGLAASRAMRFAEEISRLLAGELMSSVPDGVLFGDLGFTKWSDTQLVEGELAQGGLARSQAARDVLTGMGIARVVAPRIDELGKGYQLRVDVFDLEARAFAGTTYVTIAPRYRDELARELDAPKMQPLTRTSDHEPVGWNEVYEESVGGVVYILDTAKGTSGTGFVVSRDGLVMTNSHVVQGMSPNTVALWKDGIERSVSLILDAPELDLAILRLASVPSGMHVLELADEKDARVGLEVAVLGHPKSTGGWVLTPGHLSSLEEHVVTSSGAVRESYMYTCPTRRGNSGSPVLLLDGRVIAVNSHGTLGDVFDATGAEVQSSVGNGTPVSGELPGFSKGVPAHMAKALLARVKR